MQERVQLLRQLLGGGAEGLASIPADAVGMVNPEPVPYRLQTIGRGEVRSIPRTPQEAAFDSSRQAVNNALHSAARTVGNAVGGGEPVNDSETSFRDLGFVPGNLLGWEGAIRYGPRLAGMVSRGAGKVGRSTGAMVARDMGAAREALLGPKNPFAGAQPLHEYHMRQQFGWPIPPELEARIAAQEAMLDKLGIR